MKTTTFRTILFASTLVLALPLVAQVNTVPKKGQLLMSNNTEATGGFDFEAFKPKDKISAPASKAQPLKQIDLKKSLLRQGGINGGGGDDLALEFKRYAYAGLEDLQRNFPNVYNKIKNHNLARVIDEANVFVVDEALDVQVKDLIQNSAAFNSPEQNVIILNRKRIETIRDRDRDLLNSIALHEVLSLKELERTGYYPISGQLAQAQGQSDQTLNSVLQVDRLKQIQVLSPTATKYEVLRKLFDESQDRISLSEIDTEDDVYAGKAKWKCYGADETSPRKVKEQSIIVFTATIKQGVPGEPSAGPLFPEKPSIPPRKEPRVVIVRGHTITGKMQKSTELQFALDTIYIGSRMNLSTTQISVEGPEFHSKYSIRKNGQYITYQPDAYTVGYCYK